jgi:hypothetical protein
VLLPSLRVRRVADGRWDLESAGRRQALPVGVETPRPIGQDTPVLWSGQYPPGFLDGYVFDTLLREVFAPIAVGE